MTGLSMHRTWHLRCGSARLQTTKGVDRWCRDEPYQVHSDALLSSGGSTDVSKDGICEHFDESIGGVKTVPKHLLQTRVQDR